MASATLSATIRSDSGKGVARKLRQTGSIPGVVYGHGREPQSLTLNAREFEKLISRVAAGSTVIELDVDGKPAKTIIREIQRHPYRKLIMHVDFQEVVADQSITLKCPLVYSGTPIGVRVGGGILDQILHEVTISALPANIPEHIVVDVTELQVGRALHVGDIVLPNGVTVSEDSGATVCIVQGTRASLSASDSGEEGAGRKGK